MTGFEGKKRGRRDIRGRSVLASEKRKDFFIYPERPSVREIGFALRVVNLCDQM